MSPQELVYATAITPDGAHLLAGTGHGKLHIWRLKPPPDPTDPLSFTPPELCASVQAHRGAIYSLSFAPSSGSGHVLLSGSDEEIRGWRVEQLAAGGDPQAVLELQNPRGELRRGGLGPLSETSALALDPVSGALYSAAGDGNAYAWDLTAQKCVGRFSGHGDLLHCLAVRSKQRQLLSGSEDGTLRLWDVRNHSSTHVLRPDEPPLCPSSAATGATGAGGGGGGSGGGCGWCSCVAVDSSENWAVAGWGAGFLCSIELNTLSCVAVLPTAAAPQAVCFEAGSDSQLLSVGAESALYHWSVTGSLLNRAPCRVPSAFALAVHRQESGAQLVAVGGAAPAIDLFVDTAAPSCSIPLP